MRESGRGAHESLAIARDDPTGWIPDDRVVVRAGEEAGRPSNVPGPPVIAHDRHGLTVTRVWRGPESRGELVATPPAHGRTRTCTRERLLSRRRLVPRRHRHRPQRYQARREMEPRHRSGSIWCRALLGSMVGVGRGSEADEANRPLGQSASAHPGKRETVPRRAGGTVKQIWTHGPR